MRASPSHLLFVVGVFGCGGQAGEKLRPKDFSANDAIGGVKCEGPAKDAQPFVIDLPENARASLEIAMNKGPVVVAYDCASLKILEDCDAGQSPGEYAYETTSIREKAYRLKGADELRANLPMSAGKLSGEVKAGRSVDLGYVVIGRQSAAHKIIERADLKGECAGATHFIRRASIGAFTISTSSLGEAKAAAELFGAGAGGSSSSSRDVSSSEGSLDACRKGANDNDPPKNCHSAIMVELVPLRGKAGAGAQAVSRDEQAGPAPAANPCPPGFVYAGSLCTKAKDEAHLCESTDFEDCKAQCLKKDAASCSSAALLAGDQQAGQEWYQKGCELNDAEACFSLAYAVERANTENEAVAMPTYKKACDLGSDVACFTFGVFTKYKKNDSPAAFELYKRGCSLGNTSSCLSAALMLTDGDGIKEDVPAAIALMERACAGSADACVTYANFLEGGNHFPENLPRATELSVRECNRAPENKIPTYCETAAEIMIAQKRYDEAYPFAKRACEAYIASCRPQISLLQTGQGTKKDPAAAKKLINKFCSEKPAETMTRVARTRCVASEEAV